MVLEGNEEIHRLLKTKTQAPKKLLFHSKGKTI